jgi:hypothetical protein
MLLSGKHQVERPADGRAALGFERLVQPQDWAVRTAQPLVPPGPAIRAGAGDVDILRRPRSPALPAEGLVGLGTLLGAVTAFVAPQ